MVGILGKIVPMSLRICRQMESIVYLISKVIGSFSARSAMDRQFALQDLGSAVCKFAQLQWSSELLRLNIRDINLVLMID